MRRDRSETMTDQKKIIDELECRKKQLDLDSPERQLINRMLTGLRYSYELREQRKLDPSPTGLGAPYRGGSSRVGRGGAAEAARRPRCVGGVELQPADPGDFAGANSKPVVCLFFVVRCCPLPTAPVKVVPAHPCLWASAWLVDAPSRCRCVFASH